MYNFKKGFDFHEFVVHLTKIWPKILIAAVIAKSWRL